MENWYVASIAETLEHFNTNENTGISDQEVANRQSKYGKKMSLQSRKKNQSDQRNPAPS